MDYIDSMTVTTTGKKIFNAHYIFITYKISYTYRFHNFGLHSTGTDADEIADCSKNSTMMSAVIGDTGLSIAVFNFCE